MISKMTKASNASKIKPIMYTLPGAARYTLQAFALLPIVGSLLSCGVMTPSPSPPLASTPVAEAPTATPQAEGPTTAVRVQSKSRWVAVSWSELPGWSQDNLQEAWAAWLLSCQRSTTANAALCPEVARLNGAPAPAQQQWLMQRFQPYRVETLQGASEGLLTSYYEPVLEASRLPRPGYAIPLYGVPNSLGQRKPWFSREEIETQAVARAALKGKELVYLADPVDAMVLHIQGSGRIRVTEADGRVRTVRLAFAGTNDHPYKSIGSWLLEQGLTRDATWPGIKAWITKNPQRLNELLWKNPRVVFFKEEVLSGTNIEQGPKGAQGVPLTAGRSIAIDPGSMPYGTPVWLASSGPQVPLQKLVLAQDTGSAIVGGVRADYFAGSGAAAGDLAGRLKQPLRMWVLLPR
jgi:membrane-bound lytic murein transglycosylase A